MHWARWGNIFLAIWLILSPFILGIQDPAATWNSIIVGFLVLVFSFATNSAEEPTKGSL